jgi:hypothetical protein
MRQARSSMPRSSPPRPRRAEEPRPGDAPDQEGQSVALRDEGTYRGGCRLGGGAHAHRHGRQRGRYHPDATTVNDEFSWHLYFRRDHQAWPAIYLMLSGFGRVMRDVVAMVNDWGPGIRHSFYECVVVDSTRATSSAFSDRMCVGIERIPPGDETNSGSTSAIPLLLPSAASAGRKRGRFTPFTIGDTGGNASSGVLGALLPTPDSDGGRRRIDTIYN